MNETVMQTDTKKTSEERGRDLFHTCARRYIACQNIVAIDELNKCSEWSMGTRETMKCIQIMVLFGCGGARFVLDHFATYLLVCVCQFYKILIVSDIICVEWAFNDSHILAPELNGTT